MNNTRRATPVDFAAMRDIFDAVIAAGDTYVFGPQTSEEDIREYWFGDGVTSYVCMDGNHVVGMFKLVPNQRDRGAHIANASFMVSPEARGRGIGRLLGERCLEEARQAGYRAMQFNCVVSTNLAAIRLWRALGFAIVGTIPAAFRHEQLGYVDLYVMHKAL